MGKRELLLICGFLAIGTVVYLATAPAPAPGAQGFSISRILDHVRREMRGNRSSAEVTTTTAVPLRPGITEVRFETGNAAMTIAGEDRTDVECELKVWSSGFDETEAKQYAGQTTLKTTDAGSSLVIGIDYPRPATQRATLVVKVPRTLAVRIQPSRGKLEISDVASLELGEARGQVSVHGIGRMAGTHRGGALTIESVSELKLNTRGSTIEIKGVKGQAVMQLQAGELRAQGLSGPVELESNGTRVSLDGAATVRPIRINATGGSITITGIRAETRVEGRDTRIDIAMDKPVPVSIYNEADEPLDVTLPDGGLQLDALATDGSVRVPDGLAAVKTDENDQRVTAAINGGGPTVTLRVQRGTITIKKKAKT